LSEGVKRQQSCKEEKNEPLHGCGSLTGIARSRDQAIS